MSAPFGRREFLTRSALLTATAAGLATVRSTPAAEAKAGAGPNDRLRVAVIGVNSRGVSHVEAFAGRNNCDVVAVCDCDEAVIGKAMTAATKRQKLAPRYERDLRRVFDDKSIDAVSIATPNHWHALAAIWAMRAGKDVYVEKPASHTVREGQLMVETARKTGRLCQAGTQARSYTGMREAMAFLHAGGIGKVTLAIGLCYKPRKSIGKVTAPTPVPASLDYDLWCGPAPIAPVNRKSLHYDWHWQWATGNGDIGNQGVHELDKARWGLNRPGLPDAVQSVGGRYGYADDGQTPNTQLAVFDYPGATLLFEVRGLPTKEFRGVAIGNVWVGDAGSLVCPSHAGGIAYDRDGRKLREFKGGTEQAHFDNFVAAVRSRKVADLNADIADGHLSAALGHLANVSYRTGTDGPLPAASPRLLAGDESLGRLAAHLADNQIDPATPGRVGVKLTIDPAGTAVKPATGTRGGAVATALLTRDYRRGFDPTL